MCLAVPALIKAIDGAEAQVELGGVERVVSLLFTPEAREGDYVLVHTGFAISVVDEEEAQATLRLFEELVELPEGDGGPRSSSWESFDVRQPRDSDL